MELNEMEKRMLYQTEGSERYAILHELAMASRYAGNPDRRKAADSLIREVHAVREKTFETASMEQFRGDWKELQFLRMMDQHNYQKGRPDSERLNSFRQEIKQAGYQQVTEQMAAQAVSFNLPVFALTQKGSIDYIRDINEVSKKAPVFMKKDWLGMLDILANQKEIPCSRNTLICFMDAARDAYDKAEQADKPELAGIAIKISYFLEAVDKKGLSGILQDRDILLNGNVQIPSFLSAMERESYQYLYKAGAQEHMAVAERAAYHSGRER